MRRSRHHKLIANTVVFAVILCLTARPVLNAADPEISPSVNAGSLAKELFDYATSLSHSLHERPLEERSISDYRRALDAYWQVMRLNTSNFFSAESLARRAELQREMADVTGDSLLYQQAIETYRRLIIDHPQSGFVGDALTSIAQIYEENLQDLDGAAGAYRELINYFPKSVLAREAGAVLARFEAQLKHRPVDVAVSGDRLAISTDELAGPPRLNNVRSFSGPDYARVVIDLSDATSYTEQRTASNRLSIQLNSALVSSSLYGRRFIVGESSLLKRITVSESGSAIQQASQAVRVDIEVGSLSDYSAFRLSDPERIVIDLHAAGAIAKPVARNTEAARPAEPAGERVEASRADSVKPEPRNAKPAVSKTTATNQSPILGLPEIPDPIVPMNPAAAATQDLAAKVDAKAAESPIKRIVIDPGHGGHDTGTISPGGMREKDLVLDVARRLKAYIKHNYPDVEVILTRDSDRFVALEERTAIANSRRADLFISVHANASQSKAASGVETYFLSPDRAPSEDAETAARENARLAASKPAEKAQPVFASVTVGNRVAESRELARYIQSGLVRGIGAASPRTAMNRGVKHAAFVVLLGAAMPSVLAEVSFLSNPKDEALLQTSQFRERIAASLFAGLNAYLKKNRPAEPKSK
ncbi:MAG TPA: N-acetylmuramoyl-L-alanine amidase [Blastocatellia bacterium]|nr:N-acetylmuramoyl-L-alanine amidase [Blastocatellia bacterium]